MLVTKKPCLAKTYGCEHEARPVKVVSAAVVMSSTSNPTTQIPEIIAGCAFYRQGYGLPAVTPQLCYCCAGVPQVQQWGEEEKRQRKLVALLKGQRDIKQAEALRAQQAEKDTAQQVRTLTSCRYIP